MTWKFILRWSSAFLLGLCAPALASDTADTGLAQLSGTSLKHVIAQDGVGGTRKGGEGKGSKGIPHPVRSPLGLPFLKDAWRS